MLPQNALTILTWYTNSNLNLYMFKITLKNNSQNIKIRNTIINFD